MADSSEIIRTDPYGVMRIADTRISLDSVVTAFLQGHSPATIQEQYPGLTQAQVNGAIDYFLAHRSEVEEYLTRQAEVWRRLRAEAENNPSPVVERLRNMRLTKADP